MKSWKTSLGGALSALGTFLMGAGMLPQLGGTHTDFLYYTAFAGFVLQGLGQFFGLLFAADNRQVDHAINCAIQKYDSDTQIINKPPQT